MAGDAAGLGARLGAVLVLGAMAACGGGGEEPGAPPADAPKAEAAPAGHGLDFPPVPRRTLRVEGDSPSGGSSANAGPAGRRSDPVASTPAQPVDLPDPRAGARDADLSSAVESSVARWVEVARTTSKGKVDASNVAVAVVIAERASGRILVERLSEMPLMPASNMKLVTVASAIANMGLDGAFETRFFAAGELSAGRLEGDLVVRGGGDPLHVREGDGSLAPWLDGIAAGLRAAGIESVTGRLVLDEQGWLEPGPGPLWPSASDHWQKYCAFAGAFSANGGCFRATVSATQEGQAARVVLRPVHHGLNRKGSVKTTGKRLKVNVGANAGGVTVRGSLPASAGTHVYEFSHPDPVELFGNSLLGGLMDRGITVGGGLARERRAAPEAREVYVLRTPIRSVFDAILLDSDNAVADQLFLATGASASGEGTRDSGASATLEALARLGVTTQGMIQVDGSGLSKQNRIAAFQLVSLLRAVLASGAEVRSALVDALPVAGVSGSLRSRFKGSPARGLVRAKTGWVSGASSLSGVAETKSGQELVFSIIVGYPRVSGMNTKAWKPMQDELCELMVGWTGPGGAR